MTPIFGITTTLMATTYSMPLIDQVMVSRFPDQARLPTAPRETVRAGEGIGSLAWGLSVRSRSGPIAGTPPRRFRGEDAGDAPLPGPGRGVVEEGTATEFARLRTEASRGADGLEVSCNSCACTH